MSCIVSSSSVQSGMPCPAGAVQFLFKLPDGRKYIHCGDMRFGKHLMNNEHLQRFIGADGVYLDTTYCKTKHQFPPQVPCFLKHSHHHTIWALQCRSAHSDSHQYGPLHVQNDGLRTG